MPNPHLVSARDDQLPLLFIAFHYLRLIMRRAVAKNPNSRFVVKVRLAINAIQTLLRLVRKSEAPAIKKLDELFSIDEFGSRLRSMYWYCCP